MEEFDIREATPEDAEKIIAYLAQVGGETDYLSLVNWKIKFQSIHPKTGT